jgi:hypothetical protein
MGNRKRTVQSVFVYKVDPNRNLLYVKGQVPGKAGLFLKVKDALRKPPPFIGVDGVELPPGGEFAPGVSTAGAALPYWARGAAAEVSISNNHIPLTDCPYGTDIFFSIRSRTRRHLTLPGELESRRKARPPRRRRRCWTRSCTGAGGASRLRRDLEKAHRIRLWGFFETTRQRYRRLTRFEGVALFLTTLVNTTPGACY